MEKTITILRIVLLSLLICILCSVLVLFMNKDFNISKYINFETNSSLIYDENIEENFSIIDIYSRDLDFDFVKSKNDITNIKVYDNKNNKINITVEDDTLKIVSDNDTNNYCFFCFNLKKKAIISLPEKEYDLIIKTLSGDINSSIDFNNVTLESTSGDLEFVNIKNAKINVTSGDIEIKEVDSLEIESTSGDVEIDKINNYIDIETRSGDISIEDLTITKDSSIKVTSGDIKVEKASENIYFDTSVVSGDVKINNNNRHAEYELKIKTTSGDIVVIN